MKKLLLLPGILLILIFPVKAQVLNVGNNEQWFNQWCWAGCSKTILDYYGFVTPQQCDIAEWVRTTATFHNFGSVNCCVNASLGCNYWNYNYGYAGSIQDILVHFGGLQNSGIARSLTMAEITTEMQNNRLFVIRWGWSTGGGHFVVGHGISFSYIYFMNPWFGEGFKVGLYSYMLSGVGGGTTATHTWTHTNRITSIVTADNDLSNEKAISAYPNPFFSETTIHSDKNLNDATMVVYNAFGQEVKQIENINGQSVAFHRDNLPTGLYFIRLTQDNQVIMNDRLIIAD